MIHKCSFLLWTLIKQLRNLFSNKLQAVVHSEWPGITASTGECKHKGAGMTGATMAAHMVEWP